MQVKKVKTKYKENILNLTVVQYLEKYSRVQHNSRRRGTHSSLKNVQPEGSCVGDLRYIPLATG